jgi:hypothetical protein
MIVTNWLLDDVDTDAVTFNIGSVINPVSTKPYPGFSITILTEGGFVIVDWEGPIPWQVKPGDLRSVKIDPKNYVAYSQENTYTISFVLSNEIPLEGYVEIDFPPEIIVPDASYS